MIPALVLMIMGSCAPWTIHDTGRTLQICRKEIQDKEVYLSNGCNDRNCSAFRAYEQSRHLVIPYTSEEDRPEQVCLYLKGAFVTASEADPSGCNQMMMNLCEFSDMSAVDADQLAEDQ